MIKALLSVRFRAMWAGMTAQGKKKKKSNKGTSVLMAVLYLYVAVVVCGLMAMLFLQLAGPYHSMGLDWLYFALAGLMGLGFAVIGSVFTTQNQLYDAKDNDLLLAMPVPPGMILLSRMLPLLVMNLLFAGLVMIPAVAVYVIAVEFSLGNILLQVLGLLGVTVLAQAIACIFGWGLHLLLSKLNKSFASMLYMVAFLGIYFYVYSQAESILGAMASNGAAIGDTLKTWVWPIYALGQGSMGNVLSMLAFLVICGGVFALIYWFLSATFLHTATTRRSGKRRRLKLATLKSGSVSGALVRKELGHFLGSPVYLTNMGVGVVLMAAIAAAGVIFRGKLMMFLEVPEISAFVEPIKPLLITGVLGYLACTICVSTPAVSLEGKSIWILKSLPVSTQQILREKLKFHCLVAAPVTMAAALVLGTAYGCGTVGTVLSALAAGLLTVFCGVFGLVCGLNWARLDWISEAYPCKQSVSVIIAMLGTMGIPVVLGLLYAAVSGFVSAEVYLALCSALLGLICFGLYRLLMGWGVRKWDSL